MTGNADSAKETRGIRSRKKLSIWVMIASAVALLAITFVLFRPAVRLLRMTASSMEPTLSAGDRVLCGASAYWFSRPQRGDLIAFTLPPEASSHGSKRLSVKRVVAIGGDRVRITPGYVMCGNVQLDHSELAMLLPADRTPETRVKLTEEQVLVNGKPVTASEIGAALGEPGTEVTIVPGKVYLNGKVLDEPYVAEDCSDPYPNQSTPRKWLESDETGREVLRVPEGKLLVLGDNRNRSRDSRHWGLLDEERVTGKVIRVSAHGD